ncbi:SUF system NifU family Fe-S cluster assembly protein [Bowdeniella nasicola]|uniref:SUF system NifU family Fe-S cluster assembly protein n=1 Tax=Bowdeniella nasicola TaxID=208480 RepID=A0A1Q5Q4U1_9ACTO|nr:SUF system NifU family Fe-S cluster assembly protein [Bowdeniella nasicola]OKL54801.1 SUF system NifU family Fe-S cluster assembly protein [Bowdeniella nasicola]
MDAMEQLYQQIILDHSKARHGGALLTDYDGESFQVNTTCGDQVLLRVDMDGDRVARIGWEGEGCSISQASLSVMHDMTEGEAVADIDHLAGIFRDMMHSRGDFPDDLLDELDDASAFVGVAKFPARVKCALLGWIALADAIADAKQK